MAIQKILVANRGEIACRIFRTAQKLGIKTVGVVAPNDVGAHHRNFCDVLIDLDETENQSAYLDIDQIVELAQQHQVDAIHPGYGFLSERAEFAGAVEKTGIKFIGPKSHVISLMGKKDQARSAAEQAGVPVVPYFDEDVVTRNADDSILPLMVKAAAGGGGKGMRVVRSFAELETSIEAAKRESLKAFGDDSLLFEKYISHARHIEVQVLGDEHGNFVHLFDRECSAQRRHQKIIEEAPAPQIPEHVRRQLYSTSLNLCKQVGYTNAGTLEFIYDGENAYFLEMNTRIQVEHCVTEMITGIDLVEQQILIAQGKPLAFSQGDLNISGSAIEARVYAEDPRKNFLPQSGVAKFVHWPNNIRTEISITSGTPVTTNYDPMVGKIISHNVSRESAIVDLQNALNQTAIEGIETNLSFVQHVLTRNDFQNSSLATNTLDSLEFREEIDASDLAFVVAARIYAEKLAERSATFIVQPRDQSKYLSLYSPEDKFSCVIKPDGEVLFKGSQYRVTGEIEFGVPITLDVNNEAVTLISNMYATYITIHIGGHCNTFYIRDPRRAKPTDESSSGVIKTAMPGTVTQLKVEVGEVVMVGQVLAVMEAMKMENHVTSPVAGVVQKIQVIEGQRVAAGFELIAIEAHEVGVK